MCPFVRPGGRRLKPLSDVSQRLWADGEDSSASPEPAGMFSNQCTLKKRRINERKMRRRHRKQTRRRNLGTSIIKLVIEKSWGAR